MKRLILQLVLPLTIISFALWTRWELVDVLPIDAPDVIMVGFPLAFACDGWHTSMSLQIFVFEYLVDLVVYFGFWLLLVWLIHRQLLTIHIHWLIAVLLQLIAGIIVFFTVLVATMPEHVYYGHNPYQTVTKASGFKFIWEGNPRPE